MARGRATPREIVRKSCRRMAYSRVIRRQRLIRRRSTDALVHDLAFVRPAHRPRFAPGPAQPHDPDHASRRASPPARLRWSPICCGRPGERVRQALRRACRSASARRCSTCRPSAVRRKIQRHSGPQERVDLSFTLPVARSRPRRRSTSAPTPSRRRCSRSTGSSCRYRRITTRWRRTSASAPSIRAISSRPQRRWRTA